MNFTSDNTASVAPQILAALLAANEAPAAAYSEDPWSMQLDAVFSEVFQHRVRMFTVGSGTAANAVALACATPPWGMVFCHREAHIQRSEGGAVEFYAGGARLVPIDGPAGKITAAALQSEIDRHRRGRHAMVPAALSLSQPTEHGAVYPPAELAALSAIARRAGIVVHVDGARFSNAVAALGCAPADLTWRAGVDLLSFGATKNGALAAEAIIAFDPGRAESILRLRKRGGHLLSKSRYAAAQLLAYVEGGLWLQLAARANALALVLAEAAGPLLTVPVASNQVFIRPGADGLTMLRAAGVAFQEWGDPQAGEARLVVSWNQPQADVEKLAELLRQLR